MWVKLVTLLAQVVYAVVFVWQKVRSKRRVDDVRADPAAEWLRKLGGTDKRGSSGASDSGSDSNG